MVTHPLSRNPRKIGIKKREREREREKKRGRERAGMHVGWGCETVDLALFCKTSAMYEMHACFAAVSSQIVFWRARTRCNAKMELDQGSTLPMFLNSKNPIWFTTSSWPLPAFAIPSCRPCCCRRSSSGSFRWKPEICWRTQFSWRSRPCCGASRSKAPWRNGAEVGLHWADLHNCETNWKLVQSQKGWHPWIACQSAWLCGQVFLWKSQSASSVSLAGAGPEIVFLY